MKSKELLRFQSYLFGRQQSVSFVLAYSSKQYITCGVPLHSILGLLLFVVYVDDLHVKLKHCNSMLHADDILIYYASSHSKIMERTINKEISKLAGWFQANLLVLRAFSSQEHRTSMTPRYGLNFFAFKLKMFLTF